MNTMGTAKTVSNEDLLEVMHDLMQMTGDGFARLDTRMDGLDTRMDGLESRMDGLESRMDKIESRLTTIEHRLQEHNLELAAIRRIVDDLLNNHKAYMRDIEDILDRLSALEKRAPNITKKEVKELQIQLQAVVNWAIKAARAIKVPLELHS